MQTKTFDSQRTDVIIVGAGPVGLTLANDLAMRGVPFRIIDRLTEPNRNSRAHGMQSRTLEALDHLGLAGPMLAAAQHPQPTVLFLSGNKTVARLDPTSFHHQPYPYQLIIWQQRVERVLQDALEKRGHNVERSTRLVTFEMDNDGVTAHVDRGTVGRDVIRARWIVGCDGGHSAVRKTLGLKMRGAAIPHKFLLGEFDVKWRRSGDATYEWWHKDGMAAAIYIDFTQKWHVIVEYNEGRNGPPTVERMCALFRERTDDHRVELSNPAWITEATFYQGAPDHFIVGRAILAGDAAHVHTAAGGQGMNTGMQDALNLGWKLALTASGAASPTLLQTYESERLPKARDVLRISRRYHHIQIPHAWLARFFSGVFLKAVEAIRPLGNAVYKKIGMLDINYDDSSLSRQQSRQATHHTGAGWHVLDVPCRLGSRAAGVFEILRGPQATLLLFAGVTPTNETLSAMRTVGEAVAPLGPHLRVHYIFASEADAEAAGMSGASVIIDGGQNMQAAFGMRQPEMVYIRPDGYIGLRTKDPDVDELWRYLNLIYAVNISSAACPDKG